MVATLSGKLPHKKVYGGKTYSLLSGVYSKAEAKRYGSRLRRMGRRVRLYKIKQGEYRLYAYLEMG